MKYYFSFITLHERNDGKIQHDAAHTRSCRVLISSHTRTHNTLEFDCMFLLSTCVLFTLPELFVYHMRWVRMTTRYVLICRVSPKIRVALTHTHISVWLHYSKLYPNQHTCAQAREKMNKITNMWCEAKCRASSNSHRIDLSGKSWKDGTECMNWGGNMCWNMVWLNALLSKKFVAPKRTMMALPGLRRRLFFLSFYKLLILIHVWMYNGMMNKNDFHMWVNWIENENLLVGLDGWPNGKYEWIACGTRGVWNNICRKRNVYTLHNLVSKCTHMANGMCGVWGERECEWVRMKLCLPNEVKRQNRFDDIIVKQANRIVTTQAIALLQHIAQTHTPTMTMTRTTTMKRVSTEVKWNSLHRIQIINGFAFCMCPKCYVERCQINFRGK